MKNKMTDLRNHLFETLEGLKDRENPMPIDRAKAISEVAQTIINSAKAEIQFLEAVDSAETTDFFSAQRLEPRAHRESPDSGNPRPRLANRN